MHFTEVIRGWLGWCPDASNQKIRTLASPKFKSLTRTPAATGPVTPSTTGAIQSENRPEYQENILLIILILGGLFYAWDIRGLAIGAIISAIVVYYDAGMLHAGQKFEKETFFGDVVTWRPMTWAVCVIIGSLIFLAVYTFSRREIFDANN